MSALIEGVFRRLLSRGASPPAPVESEPADKRTERRRPAEGSALLEWIDQDDCERGQAVHLIDEGDDGMSVRSPVGLESGWPVLLTQPAGAPVKAVVRYRRRDPRGWILGLQVIRQERRRFDRRPLDHEISLSWEGSDGRRRRAVGRVRDGGEGGLRFVCRCEIPLRASVKLAIDGWQRFGTIVNVQAESDLRRYGVQFSSPPTLIHSADFEE